MQEDPFSIIRIVFTGLFFLVLFVGGYVVKNYQKLFGADPNVPTDNESARAFTKVQMILVWIHAVVLTGAFALMMH